LLVSETLAELRPALCQLKRNLQIRIANNEWELGSPAKLSHPRIAITQVRCLA
jgi:hypothetical protein